MRLVLLSPGDPGQKTGGYLYNRRLVAALRARGVDAEILALSWPLAPGDAARVNALPAEVRVLADGLLWEALQPQLTRPAAVLVHSLRAWEPGQPESALAEELGALAQTRARICTGPQVQSILSDAGLHSTLALPGVTGVPGPKPSGPVHLLCVATLTARKGHARLLHRLASLAELEWTLDCVGSKDREPETTARLEGLRHTLSLTDRVRFVGEHEDMLPHYHRAHALVHAAHHEAFGMALSEAVAHGRPVLSTPAGALAVLPDAAVLALDERLSGLETYLRDPGLRARLWQGAQGAALAGWGETAERVVVGVR